MFTKEDYLAYFNELETIYKETIVIYTDLINELDNHSVRSKLSAMANDNMASYRFITKEKEKF